MKSFREYREEGTEEVQEGVLRGASALMLFNRIRDNSKKVLRSKNVNERLNLIASQNVNLAAMMFAMTQFTKKE